MNFKLKTILEKLKIFICIWILETLFAVFLSFFKSIFELSNFFENADSIVVINILRLTYFNWILLIWYLATKKLSLKKCIKVDISVYLFCCLIFALAVENNWKYILGYSFVSNLVSIAIAPFLFEKLIVKIYENKFDCWLES